MNVNDFYREELEKKKTISSKKAFLTKEHKLVKEHLQDLLDHKKPYGNNKFGYLHGEPVTALRISRTRTELKVIENLQQELLTNKSKGMKSPAKTTTKRKTKKRTSATSLCRKVIKVPGLNAKGQLLKGWHYVNGKPVKSKPAAKKKPAVKTRLNAPAKKYKVMKTLKSGSRTTLASGLTQAQAKRIVNSFPNNDKYIVTFVAQ